MNTTEINQKARALINYMNNDEGLFTLQLNWAALYTKKIKSGKFNIERAIDGMDNLRKSVQAEYNKEYEKISVSKNELRYILKEFLESVLYLAHDDNDELKPQIMTVIKQLEGTN